MHLFLFFPNQYDFDLGKQENYHGHVTALSIAPEFRRIGVSSALMALLEKVSEQFVLLCWIFFEFYLIFNY
jgi:ribosomal protein S18 acetylase RimI-like enzyme